MDGRDEDGVPVNTRGVFLQVIKECLSHEGSRRLKVAGAHTVAPWGS